MSMHLERKCHRDQYEIIWSKNTDFVTTLIVQPSLTSLPLNAKFSAISYLIELKFGMHAK